MSYLKNNCIVLTPQENDILQAKLDTVECPIDYIDILKDLWAQHNLKLDLYWSPTFIERNNEFYFRGDIKGKTTDLLNGGSPRSEVYSLDIAVDIKGKYAWSDNKLLRFDTGSGGGGSTFNYSYLELNIKDFPAMKAKYTQQYDEAFVKSNQQQIQSEYDAILENRYLKFNSSLSKCLSENKDIKASNDLIESVQKILKQIKDNHKQLELEVLKQASLLHRFDVPKPSIAFLNYSMYNKCIEAQTQHTDVQPNVVGFIELEKKYAKIVSDNAEMYL